MWARYEASSGSLDQSHPPRNGTVSELVEELRGSSRVLVTGELDDNQAGLIGQLDGVSLPPLPLRMRYPGALAELAWRRLGAPVSSMSRADRAGLPLPLIAAPTPDFPGWSPGATVPKRRLCGAVPETAPARTRANRCTASYDDPRLRARRESG